MKKAYSQCVPVTDDNFNEFDYLVSNPDVLQAVRDGKLKSGRAHFKRYGRAEKRKIKLTVHRLINLLPNFLIQYIVGKYVERIWAHASGPFFDEIDWKYNRYCIISQFIRTGTGIEIGALHDPAKVSAGVRVKYVDRLSVLELRQQYPELHTLPLVNVDIIANGETLIGIPDLSQDFVIANHFLEHCENPLLAIENMYRVLKCQGILFMAIPDKRYTFDADRPTTSYEHLINDYNKGAGVSKNQHYEEWIRFVKKVTDETGQKKMFDELVGANYSIHFHAWTQKEMIEMVINLKNRIKFEIVLIYSNNEKEMIFVLKKNTEA